MQRDSILFFLVFSFFSCQNTNSLKVSSITINNREEATGVNPENFFFSWKLHSSERNVIQNSYHIQVAETMDFSGENLCWDSGLVEDEKSILVHFKGKKLEPGQTYFWKVKVTDNYGNKSTWSNVANFTTGLFTENDWTGAKWIAFDTIQPENRLVPGIHLPGKEYSGKDLGFHILPYFRKEFEMKKYIKQALVFVTGLGHYEMSLNGMKVGDRFLSPGWTHYDETVLYNTFDVTELMNSGQNTLGFLLGNGFFNVPNNRYRKVMSAYANPMMKMKLQLFYADGTSESVVSDESWKTSPSPLTYSSIYAGESWNATLEQTGWNLNNFDDSNWQNVILVNSPCKNLLPEKTIR